MSHRIRDYRIARMCVEWVDLVLNTTETRLELAAVLEAVVRHCLYFAVASLS